MINFELVGASDWWMVTKGGSLDDIQIIVSVDQCKEFKLFISLRELLELYESAYYEVPTVDHESSYATSYRVIERNDHIIVRSLLHDWKTTTTYQELRTALENLLSDIFQSLDQSSNPGDRERGLEYIKDDVKIDVQTLYARLSNE